MAPKLSSAQAKTDVDVSRLAKAIPPTTYRLSPT